MYRNRFKKNKKYAVKILHKYIEIKLRKKMLGKV